LLFTITGKHVDITEAIRAHASDKTAKLPKYYDSLTEVGVVVESGKGGNVEVEILAKAKRRKPFVAKVTGLDAYTCIDLAVHKLEEQLRRAKTRQRNNKHISGT